MSELATEIIQYRAKYNLTQKEFAELCRLKKLTILQIENGLRKSLRAVTIAKIRKVLDDDK